MLTILLLTWLLLLSTASKEVMLLVLLPLRSSDVALLSCWSKFCTIDSADSESEEIKFKVMTIQSSVIAAVANKRLLLLSAALTSDEKSEFSNCM